MNESNSQNAVSCSDINLIVVCGPTASGKTHLGVALAESLQSEVLSVDSRQLYRGMDIGTGKDIDEYTTPNGSVPYHLIDIAEPTTIYTLWHFQRDFYAAFNCLRDRDVIPVAVGGTGLYLEAVLKHYEIPNIPEDEALRKRLMEQPQEQLLQQLKELSPSQFDQTDITSKKRIVRAIEIALQEQKGPILRGHPNPPTIHPFVIGVRWERSILRQRIRQRLVERLDEGMIDEIKTLMDQGVSDDRLDLFGMEYRRGRQYLRGEIDYDSMVEKLNHDICRLAKRQETYFRGMERRGIPVTWIDDANITEAIKQVSETLEH